MDDKKHDEDAENQASLKTEDGKAACHVLLRSEPQGGGYEVLITQHNPIAATWTVTFEGREIYREG